MSGLRAAARCIVSTSRRSLHCQALMSTRASDTFFQTPSFSASEDSSLWQDKYPRADPSHLWKVGSFPLQFDQEDNSAMTCSEDLWDTSGMLSALEDNLPLRHSDGSRDVDELLRQMDGYLADSVVKKRRKKMNKHKHRKRKKVQHMLKKLASPKKKAQHGAFGASTSIDAPDTTGLGAELKSPEAKKKKKKGIKTRFKEKAKEKPKPKTKKKDKAEETDADVLGFDESTLAGNVSSEKAKEVEDVGSTEEKPLTKKSLGSPKKRLKKLTKAEKKHKLMKDKQEVESSHDAIDPSAATAEEDLLTPRILDTATRSSKRKNRWKITDIKHRSEPSNQKEQEEPIYGEQDSMPNSAQLSPNSDSDASRENVASSRVYGKQGKANRRQLSAVENSSSSSDLENQAAALSPLRRHKPNPDDTLPIPEAPYDPYRFQKRLAQLNVSPAYQPEVHLIGEIVSGHGFGAAGGLTCKWRVEYGSRWSLIAGDQNGQTQIDHPSIAPWTSDPDVAVWSHPIDLHFATSAFQGWPRFLFQVWRTGSNVKLHVVGYGFVPIPFAAGQHKLWVSLWRPLGSTKEELDAQLLGCTPELKSDDVLFNSAWSERCRLRTISTGKILVHVEVLLRHFQAGVIEA